MHQKRRKKVIGLALFLVIVLGTAVALAPFTGGEKITVGDGEAASGPPQVAPLADGPTIWTVSPTPGSADFTVIQQAIDAAAPGDLIEVWSGTYYENVVVDKPLILYARDGPATTIVDANGSGITIHITADDCTVNGFTVTGSGGRPGDAGIKVESDGNAITDNLCTGNGYDGLAVIDVVDNVLTNNTCSENFRDGIHLWDAEHTTITENQCDLNRYGLSMLYAAKNTLEQNNFYYNGRSGLFMLSSSQNRLDENAFWENDWEGLYAADCYYTIFWMNEFRANLDDGLCLEYSSGNTIVRNELIENAEAGIYLFEASDNLIYQNDFVNNSLNVNSIESDNRWNSSVNLSYTYGGDDFTNYTGNYWNDYGAFTDTNGDGIADLPYNIYEELGNGTEDDFDYFPLIESRASYTVDNIPPSADFSFAPSEPVENEPVTFDASFSYDLDGALVLYEWDFGDDSEASTTDPMSIHAYTTAGEYTVTLTVFDDADASSTVTSPITVLLPLRVHNMNTGEDFTMIQAAIDAPNTSAGDLIEVDPGTYAENVQVTESLIIQSTSGDPGDTLIEVTDPATHGVEILADGVGFSGFTVAGATGADAAGICLNGVTACSVTNNAVIENDFGILLDDSPANELAGNYIAGSTQSDLYIQASADNMFTENTLASYPTTISFTYSGDLALSGVDVPPADPNDTQNIGKYLDVTNLTPDAWLDLKIHYAVFDLGNVNESTLHLYRFINDSWTLVPGTNGVDAANDFVYANLTSFSIIAPLGVPLPPVRNVNTSEIFALIQDAIDDTETLDGHVLEVAPGYYPENVYVYKTLTIRSYYDVPETTIVGAANSSYDVFAVVADNVTIRGFMIGGAFDASGIYLLSAGNTITNNLLTANYVGVYAEQVGQPTGSRPARLAEQLATVGMTTEPLAASAEPSPAMERGMSSVAQHWAHSESASFGRARALSIQQTPRALTGTRSLGNGNSQSGYNTITDNLLVENVYGIAACGSIQNAIRDNAIEYNYYSGIYLELSDYNTIEQNNFTANEFAGLEVAASSNNMIRQNTISSNYYGAVLYTYCSFNTITENMVSGNYEEGISLGDLSSGNYIIANTVTDTQQHSGISIWGASSHNIIANNTVFDSSNYAGIALYDYSNYNTIVNNTANGNMGGLLIFFDGGRFNNITDNRFDANYDGIVLLGACDDNYIANNSITYNYDGAMFIVNSNNNTIEANNCSYSETFSGIELQSSSNNNVLDHNTVNANAVHGISLWETSHHNIVTNNTANSNGYHGIMLTNAAHNNTITDNTACYNKLGGITVLRSCTDNTIADNELCANLIGIGVLRLDTAPRNNPISGNEVRECESGILLADLEEPNNVTKNTVTSNNLFGIVTLNSIGTTIHNNTASMNKRGIGLLESSAMQVTENTVDFNTFSGLSLIDSSGNNITENSATFNVYEGVHLANSYFNNISYNNVSGNYFGITLYSSHNNTLIDNIAESVYYYEVFLFDSEGNNADADNATVDGAIPYTQAESIHGVHVFIPETLTPSLQAVEPGENATYYLVVENLGILADTFTLNTSSTDEPDLWSLDLEMISLGAGESSARITEFGFETITLTVNDTEPGIYRVTVEVVSQSEATVKGFVETWTIVTGVVNSVQENATITGSVLNNASVVESVITKSAIINSSIEQSTVTDSIVRDSTVSGSVLSGIILESASVANGNISHGAITINGIRYVIQKETSIDTLILAAYRSESNLVGLRNAKLLVIDTGNATMGFEINASDDYFAGTLLVQKAVIPPEGIPEYVNSTGEYYFVEASENLANSTGWLILKIYYDPDQLTGFNLSSLTILCYNEDLDTWEELPVGGINTIEHYVWVNISHYSVFAVLAQPTSGGDGGDGGDGGETGGGAGGGRYNPAEIAIGLANPGTNNFNFEHLGLAISKILIDLKSTAFNVKVALKQIEKPAGTPNPLGIVYYYFDLPNNLAAEDIQSAQIFFQVSKSWIAANNIDISSILLTRYAASGWEPLGTALINEDSEYYYFSAETSALSLFAIAGTQEAAAGGPTPSPTATPFGTPTPSPGPAATPTPTPAKRIPSCGMVAVLGAIALTILIRRSRLRRA